MGVQTTLDFFSPQHNCLKLFHDELYLLTCRETNHTQQELNQKSSLSVERNFYILEYLGDYFSPDSLFPSWSPQHLYSQSETTMLCVFILPSPHGPSL